MRYCTLIMGCREQATNNVSKCIRMQELELEVDNDNEHEARSVVHVHGWRYRTVN